MAGISPKQFLQYTNLRFSRPLLEKHRASLSETSHLTGLSGTGRLHHLYITLEAMTPGEFKNGGAGLRMDVCFYDSLLGKAMVASTHRGICRLEFISDEKEALMALQKKFFAATITQQHRDIHTAALGMLQTGSQPAHKLNLHLKGTPFQVKVWEALLRIPEGRLTTYQDLAASMGQSTAARAVGNAVGSNPVAVLIPCHRVIRNDGSPGGYRWGLERKTVLLGRELNTANFAENE